MSVRIIQGDMREWLAEMAADSVDSIVTDPPYGLGFMGKGWDHGVPGVEFWVEALRVAKPGAYLLAFGGTRTFHRLAVAIEDAGWELRDTVMWVYGSGFPKSRDVSKAIDKAAGAERELTRPGVIQRDGYGGDWDTGSSENRPRYDTPSTDAAKQWQGWGTALKPAWEPIVVARKPLIGTVAENVLKHGTGGLNIDGCRVATDGEVIHAPQSDPSKREGVVGSDLGISGADIDKFQAAQRASIERTMTLGRWPANLIHDGSDEVLACFPDAKGQLADAKTSGERKFGNVYSPMRYGEASADSDNEGGVGFKMKPGARRLDSGSAAPRAIVTFRKSAPECPADLIADLETRILYAGRHTMISAGGCKTKKVPAGFQHPQSLARPRFSPDLESLIGR